MAPATPAVPTLPLRADVLLSNALFEELDDGISAELLRHCTGQQDLGAVDFVELQVDAVGGRQRVECLGEFLPNLQQLRLNQSSICTIRDLGTSLTRLRVLWLCRCSLQDLGGVTAMPVLEELYVSFNDVRELSPLCTHESLQVLDLEGNLVDDLEEVRALQAVASLRELNLSLNPLWRCGARRRDVLEALPQLEVLDDLPRGAEAPAPAAELLEGGPEGLEALEGLEGLGALGALEDLEDLEGPEGPEGPGGPGAPAAAAAAGAAGAVGPGPPRAWPAAGPAEASPALGRLRERARPRGAAPAGADAGAAPPPAEARRGAGPGGPSAVEALRAGRARLRGGAGAAPAPAPGPGEPGGPGEPSEQDLIVERLKRAERPAPSAWRFHSASARPADAGRRPPTGFFPDRRPLTAWSSGRPTTASSGTGAASSRSLALSGAVVESEAASELTSGEDGALAGNPLGAVRRRRRVAAAQGEDELSIWNLLRRTEAEAGCPEARPGAAEGRLATPDVRIGPPRPLAGARSAGAAAPRAAGAEAAPRPTALGGAEVLRLE